MSKTLGLKYLCASISLLALLMAPAVSSGAANPGAAPAANPGPPVQVSPEMRAAVKELLEITKFRETLANSFNNFSQSLPQQMSQGLNASVQQNQQLSEEQKQLVRERLGKSFDAGAREAVAAFQDPKVVDEILDNSYPVFAKYFTVNDLQAINAFYKSPAGSKWVAMLPQLTNDFLNMGMAKVQPRVNRIMNSVLKKELDAVQRAKPAK